MNHIGKALGWMIFRHSPWWADGQSSGGLLVIEWDRTEKTKVRPWQYQVTKYDKWGYSQPPMVIKVAIILGAVSLALCIAAWTLGFI